MSVKIEGLEKVTRKLESLNSPAVFRRGMQRAVNHVKKVAQDYPEKAQGAFSALATPGQRAAYWAKVSSGEIQHAEGIGYVRSGRLKGDWSTKVYNNGRTGEVLNNTSYGPFVQSQEAQQPFHKQSKWQTTEQIAGREAKAVVEIFEDEYNRELNK